MGMLLYLSFRARMLLYLPLLIVSLGGGSALASRFQLLPRATEGVLHNDKNFQQFPTATSSPVLRRAAADEHKVHRRQQQTLGYDTCGYLSGNANEPMTCGLFSACMVNTVDDIFGCCSTDAYGDWDTIDCSSILYPYSGCYGYYEASYCTGSCEITNGFW